VENLSLRGPTVKNWQENGLRVPVRILVAFVAELKLYRFWGGEGLFAEFLRILEKMGDKVLCRAKFSAHWFLTGRPAMEVRRQG